jgi:subtilisin family serine protease
MRHPLIALSVLVAGTLAVALPSTATAQSASSEDPDIVVLKDSADAKRIAAEHSKRHGFEVVHTYRFALEGYAARLSPDQAAAVRAERAVLFVETQDVETELPPTGQIRKLQGAGRQQSDQYVPWEVDRLDAEISSARVGDGRGRVPVNVAVLDGGIQPDHPDLNVIDGVNCLEGRHPRAWADRDGHGTFVAGKIGALDNRFGVVGYAPGVRMFAVRVARTSGYITSADLICGIDWVTRSRLDADRRNDIAVANMSLSGVVKPDDERCGRTVGDAEHYAICGLTDAGVTSAVAAGNDSYSLTTEGPATYREVLTVTAMADFDGEPGGNSPPDCLGFDYGQYGEADDTPAVFSNWAVLPADAEHTVAAPGVCVYSTYFETQYATWDGTSFSTPVVAALVALCIDTGECAGLGPKAIVRKIARDAAAYNQRHPDYGYEGDPFRPVDDRYYGYLVNAGIY